MLGLEVMVRLPRAFDRDRLQADLRALSALRKTYFEEQHRTGLWGGVSLYAQGGRFDVLTCGDAPYEPTEALARAPNLAAIVDAFETETHAVRVLTLDPGARIHEHYDPQSSLDRGVARLHVPIVTHPDVEFLLAGRRTRWREGELWYGDFTFPHRAHNKSPVARAHLVMDLVVNDRVRSLFPPEWLAPNPLRDAHRRLLQAWSDAKTTAKHRVAALLRPARG